ncbi:ion transporter [Flavonifractor hominis]|uniref:Ion transporter n=1 Tax=Flavonifractor hominis TaxID=3133178 RepID=A0ABV1ET13_9FIRM
MGTSVWDRRRKRVFEIIEVGTQYDYVSRAYDFFNAACILLNLLVNILYTFGEIRAVYGELLVALDEFTVLTFGVDYVLRVWTAKFLYPDISEGRAVRKYVLSFTGLVDMLSFLPHYLPIFFPAGAVAFRALRVVRIFRLFRINAYYDSLNVITEVIMGKKQQLFSSVFIILMLMIASSLCMYSLEHEAQPEVFTNAFSGIWWSASTLLTVGYGDIYPVTPLGKVFSIFITFLGVGMVAIPTGIISAGFVDQYSRIKRMAEYGQEAAIHFIKITLSEQDCWSNRSIQELNLPKRVIIAAIQRNGRVLIPRGNVVLRAGDSLVLGAESFREQKEHIRLKEVVLQKNNPWNGLRIRELDISRHTIIVLIKRGKRTLIPTGEMFLREGDSVILYTQTNMRGVNEIEI